MTTETITPATEDKNPANPASADIILSCNDLHRTFHSGTSVLEVLKGVSLEVQAGEKLFLTGPSGAGKTTLLYTLAGLEKPSAGDVCFRGESIYRLSTRAQARIRNRSMGYIFQNYHLLPELTALENVAMPAMIGGSGGRKRAAELLETVGLGERMTHLPTQLSGGEQQRVAIARALANDPELIFADEPTGNLDSKTGESVMEVLLSAVAERGKTLMVVTHDQTLARLGDRKLVLADGRLAE
ncbi:MAG: ABC transporter ATP-binding protein [Verrucomicrobiota bacterium]